MWQRIWILLLLLVAACTPKSQSVPTLAALPVDAPVLNFWETERGTLQSSDSMDEWLFLARAGDNISLRVVNQGAEVAMTLLQAEQVLAEGSTIELSLPEDGRYSVQVRPVDGQIGNYDIGLGYTDRTSPSQTRPLRQVVGVPTPTPAFTNLGAFIEHLTEDEAVGSALTSSSPQHVYTFEGATGEVINIEMTRVSGTLDPFLTLYDPNGKPVAMDDNSGGNGAARLSNVRLLMDGLYSIQVEGTSLYGDYSLAMNRGIQQLEVDAVETPTIIPATPYATPTLGPVPGDSRLVDHVPVIGTLPRSGDFQRFSFAATTGDTVTVLAQPYQDSGIRPKLEIFGPQGNLLDTAQSATSTVPDSAFVQNIRIEEDGIYTIIVTSEDNSFGAYTLSAGKGSTALDVFHGTAESNQRYTGSLLQSGERHSWQVDLQPGDVITVAVSSIDNSINPVVQLATIDGVVLYQDSNSGTNGAALIRIAEIVSPATYVLHVMDNEADSTGDYTLLWRYVNAAPTLSPLPQLSTILSIDGLVRENQYEFYVFQGLAGQRIQIRVDAQADSQLDPVVALLDPNGTVIAEADDSNGTLNPVLTTTLRESGTYSIRVNGYLSSGTFDLSVAIEL